MAHFCVSQCDIYSTKTNNPPTSEFQQNSGLFLTGVVSSLGWRKSSLRTVTQRHTSTQGLTRESMEIACLPFCAWGRRWHMPPSTCKGGREVCSSMCLEGEENGALMRHGRSFQWLGHSYCFKWEVTSVFPSMPFFLFSLNGGFFKFCDALQFSKVSDTWFYIIP